MKKIFIYLLLIISISLQSQNPFVDAINFKEYTTIERDLIDLTTLGTYKKYIFNKTTNQLEFFDGVSWSSIGGSGEPINTFNTDLNVNGLTVGRGLGNNILNTVFGYNSMLLNTTGERNTSIGYESLRDNLEGSYNISIGFESMLKNTHGASNIGIGESALKYNLYGIYNVAIGSASLSNNKSSNNTAVGYASLTKNSTGSYNTAVGRWSSFNNTSGSQNSSLGSHSLEGNKTGSYNVSIGQLSMSRSVTGSYNVSVGSQAGLSALVNTYNYNPLNSIFIGANSRSYSDNDVNQVVIGYSTIGNGTNTVTIGNNDITDNYFKGNIHATNINANWGGLSTSDVELKGFRTFSAGTSGVAGNNPLDLNTDTVKLKSGSNNQIMSITKDRVLIVGGTTNAIEWLVNGSTFTDSTSGKFPFWIIKTGATTYEAF